MNKEKTKNLLDIKEEILFNENYLTNCLTKTTMYLYRKCEVERMAKMGRPKKDETKNKSIGIRLSKEYYIRVMQYAAEHDLTITQVVQRALELLFHKS